MTAPNKFEKLQEMIFAAPEYLSLPDVERAACKRFLVLAVGDAPDANELEVAFYEAACEVRGLAKKGRLTGINLAEVYAEATTPIAVARKGNGAKYGPCPGCGLYETWIFEGDEDDGDDEDDEDDEKPKTPPKPGLCGLCDKKKREQAGVMRAKKSSAKTSASEGPPGATSLIQETVPIADPANDTLATEASSPSAETQDERASAVESPAVPPAPSSNGDFPEREVHPVANIFPMMSEADLKGLADDIKANGLRDDIITFEGKVVDGRHREAACKLVGVVPRYREWDGTGSLVAWVMSANLHRRHLDDQQRAMVAAKAKEAYEAEAEARRISNLSRNGGSVESADLRSREPQAGKSAAKAAEQLGVSTRAVEQASRVLKQGDGALVEAVTQGKVSLDAANNVSMLPRPEQKNLVKSGGVKAAAAELRRMRTAKRSAAQKPNTEKERPTDLRNTTEPSEEKPANPSGTPEPIEEKPAAPSVVTKETSTPGEKNDALSRGIAALPDSQRLDLKGLLMKTGALAFKIPSATADEASLVLRGLGALVVRAHGFLSGEDDGAFLRDALEAEGETYGDDQ